MAKLYFQVAIFLLFCFVIALAQFTTFKCVDEKCSGVIREVKALTDSQPFKGFERAFKKGDAFTLYGLSENGNLCLVKGKQAKEFSTVSCNKLKPIPKDLKLTTMVTLDMNSSLGELRVVSSNYGQDLNDSSSNSLNVTSGNLTAAEFEVNATSENMSPKLNENLKKDEPNLNASSNVKTNETSENVNSKETEDTTRNSSALSEPSSISTEDTKTDFIRKPSSTIESSSRSWKQWDWKLKSFLNWLNFQSSIKYANSSYGNESAKVEGDHVTEKSPEIEKIKTDSPVVIPSNEPSNNETDDEKIKTNSSSHTMVNEPSNNETDDEIQEINAVLNFDIQKERATVGNHSNKVVDDGKSVQGVETNNKLDHSPSYDDNSTDASNETKHEPSTAMLDTEAASNETKYEPPTTKPGAEAASNETKYEPPTAKSGTEAASNETKYEPATAKPATEVKQNVPSHAPETVVPNFVENVKTDDPGSTIDTNNSAVETSDVRNATSETTSDTKVEEAAAKAVAKEGDDDTSEFYNLLGKKKMRKIEPDSKIKPDLNIEPPRPTSEESRPNTDESSSFSDTIFEYIPDSSSVMQCFDTVKNTLSSFWHSEKEDAPSEDYCRAEADCASESAPVTTKAADTIGFVSFVTDFPFEELRSKNSKTVFVCFVSTLFFIIFATFYVLVKSQNKERVNSLATAVNQLEKKLFVAKREIVLLNEKLDSCDVEVHNEDQAQDTVEVEANSTLIAALEEQVKRYQRENTELEDRVVYFERELESVSTSALEMHKLLENSLSTQASSKIAEDEVECLKTLTEKQESQIEDLIREMDLIVSENQCLKDELKKVQKENGSQVKKNLELTEKLRNLKLRLDLQIESHNLQCNNYKSEIDKMVCKLEDAEMNLKRSEFQIAELMKEKGETDLANAKSAAAIDHSQLRVQLATLKAMNNELTNELKEQKKARRTLDEHVGDVIRELNDVKKSNEIIEKERNEAVTKLHVLTDYFKDKESQLHKELEEKDKLSVENEYKDQLLSQKLASLKEEIENQKKRNDELRKEIEDQENSFKIQLANAEEKTRDHWFMLRQAERKYQESEKEAATLRNRVLILETTLSNQKLNDKTNLNGDVSPIPVLYHNTTSPDLLPYRNSTEIMATQSSPLASHSMEFFPPAPPSYSTDERLPPLGGRRVPSPPMSIDDYDDFEPPPPSFQYVPPARNRHEQLPISSSSFVPPPPPSSVSRHRNQYEGLDSSSGVSVESLDKSGR